MELARKNLASFFLLIVSLALLFTYSVPLKTLNSNFTLSQSLQANLGGPRLSSTSFSPIIPGPASLLKEAADFDEIGAKNGWIAVLPDKSVLERKSELERARQDLGSELLSQRNKVRQGQVSFENKIKSISNKVKVSRKFENTINALVLKDLSPQELNKFKALAPEVEFYPNLPVQATLMDSIPMINADNVWRLNTQGKPCISFVLQEEIASNSPSTSNVECLTGKGVTVGIIDTGIDYTHDDLGGCTSQEFLSGRCRKVIGGWDFVNDGPNPIDDNGHGTHVAATAAGNGTALDGTILKGVAPEAKLVAFKVLNSAGSGSVGNVIAAIEKSFDLDGDGYIYRVHSEENDPDDIIDIISLSLGTLIGGHPDDPQSQAIDTAVENGVIATIAMGNLGSSFLSISSPGTARKAISVGAACKSQDVGVNSYCDTNIASFSARGPNFNGQIKPDVVAPGVKICAARYNSAYPEYVCLDENHIAPSGTSMATPHVAGMAALLKQKHPNYKPEQIKMIIKQTASFYDLSFPNPNNNSYSSLSQGRGLINALAAVQFDTIPPIIRAELSNTASFPAYVYSENPFILNYEVEHSLPGKIIIKRGNLSSSNLEDAVWENISIVPSNPPVTSGVLPFSTIGNEENFAEVYRVEFTPNDEKSPLSLTSSTATFYEDTIIFVTPPNSLEGWPLNITLGPLFYCRVEGVDAGFARSSLQKDVRVKYVGNSCPLYFDYSSLFNSQGEDEGQLLNDHGKSIRSLYFDINGDDSNDLTHDNHVYDSELNQILNLGSGIYEPPIIDDINADSVNDIIQAGNGSVVITSSLSGTQSSAFFSMNIPGNNTFGGRVAVGDIDNDGFKEIVSNSLYYIKYFGGSSFQSDFIEGPDGDLIAISDLDKNGFNDIILIKWHDNDPADSEWEDNTGSIYIYEQNALKYSGDIPTGVDQVNTGSIRSTDFALADVVSDENIEIVVPTDTHIYIFDWQANLIDEVELPPMPSSPSAPPSYEYFYAPVFVYDINQDNTLEILRPLDKLYIYNNELELISGSLDLFAIGPLLCKPTWPFFTDLNNDGILDLLTNNWGNVACGGLLTIHAWNTGIPYTESENYWINPYDSGNTRCHMCNKVEKPICLVNNPSVTVAPSSQLGSSGDTLLYNVVVTNNNNLLCEPAAFDVISQLPSGFTQEPVSFSTPPIQSQNNYSTTIELTSSLGLESGDYSFTETAINVEDPQYSGSDQGIYTLYAGEGGYRVFATSQSWNGDLGGLEEADAKCQLAADNANLGGIWKAWLSDSSMSASDRLFHSSIPYVLLSGAPIALNWNDLVDGIILQPISLDEYVDPVTEDSDTWTGTWLAGDSSINNCSNWTNLSAQFTGTFGSATDSHSYWTNANIANCSYQFRIYCFEQPFP